MSRLALRLAPVLAAALLAACQQASGGSAGPAPPAPVAEGEPADAPAAPAPAEELAEDILPSPSDAATPAPAEELAEDPLPSPSDAATPDTPAPAVPHIYMALQPGGTGHPTSVVFAIDAARDGTPSDDPAIRLTPDAGRCNPQEMRRYDFPPGDAARPVVGDAEGALGLTAQDLPRFLAAAVTGRMLDAGLASEPEDTRGLNVCTRKLWERLVVAENQGRLARQ
jgi:hypothetical protein